MHVIFNENTPFVEGAYSHVIGFLSGRRLVASWFWRLYLPSATSSLIKTLKEPRFSGYVSFFYKRSKTIDKAGRCKNKIISQSRNMLNGHLSTVNITLQVMLNVLFILDHSLGSHCGLLYIFTFLFSVVVHFYEVHVLIFQIYSSYSSSMYNSVLLFLPCKQCYTSVMNTSIANF